MDCTIDFNPHAICFINLPQKKNICEIKMTTGNIALFAAFVIAMIVCILARRMFVLLFIVVVVLAYVVGNMLLRRQDIKTDTARAEILTQKTVQALLRPR